MTVPLRRVLPATTGRAVDARALSELVRTDVVLSGRLERYADQFFTRFDGRVGGGGRALRVVGGQVTALLALIEAMLAELRGSLPAVTGGRVWTDAIAGAVAARLSSQVDRSVDPDLAFAVTLIAGMGTGMVLAGDPEAQLAWWRHVYRVRGGARRAAEDALFQVSPVFAAAEAALALGAPDELVRLIVASDPSEVEPSGAEVVRVRIRAMSLAHALSARAAGPELARWVAEMTATSSVSARGAWAMIDEVLATTPVVAKVFELPVRPHAPRDVLLTRTGGEPESPEEHAAHSALQDLVIASLRARLVEADGQMQRRRQVDPVTGLLDVRAFVRRLSAALGDPAEPVSSVVAVDVSDFGALFIDEGVKTSDRVLARVAAVLDRAFPRSDLITRCGPATFLVATPTDPRTARIQSQRAQASLDAAEIPGARGPVQVDTTIAVLDVATLPVGVSAEAAMEHARTALWARETPRWVRGR